MPGRPQVCTQWQQRATHSGPGSFWDSNTVALLEHLTHPTNLCHSILLPSDYPPFSVFSLGDTRILFWRQCPKQDKSQADKQMDKLQTSVTNKPAGSLFSLKEDVFNIGSCCHYYQWGQALGVRMYKPSPAQPIRSYKLIAYLSFRTSCIVFSFSSGLAACVIASKLVKAHDQVFSSRRVVGPASGLNELTLKTVPGINSCPLLLQVELFKWLEPISFHSKCILILPHTRQRLMHIKQSWHYNTPWQQKQTHQKQTKSLSSSALMRSSPCSLAFRAVRSTLLPGLIFPSGSSLTFMRNMGFFSC